MMLEFMMQMLYLLAGVFLGITIWELVFRQRNGFTIFVSKMISSIAIEMSNREIQRLRFAIASMKQNHSETTDCASCSHRGMLKVTTQWGPCLRCQGLLKEKQTMVPEARIGGLDIAVEAQTPAKVTVTGDVPFKAEQSPDGERITVEVASSSGPCPHCLGRELGEQIVKEMKSDGWAPQRLRT